MFHTLRSVRFGPSSTDHSLYWAVGVLFAALPWLLPTRALPWATFYAEALAAATMIVACTWALAIGGRDSSRVKVDASARAMLLLALVPVAQAASGLLIYRWEAVLPSAYLAAAAVVVIASNRAQTLAPWKLAEAVWASLVLAAFVSVGLALRQWLQLDWGMFAAPTSSPGRATANVGQPNNLSTLLCWGLVGLWWGWRRSRLQGWVTVSAAAFLIVGIVLAQSRTAWPVLLGMGAMAALGRRHLAPGRSGLVFAGLGVWYIALTVALSDIASALLLTSPRPLSDLSDVGLRPVIWKVALHAVLDRPWSGFGWNQFLVAWVDIRPPQPTELVSYTHNIVLDLLVWNGLPIGVAIVVGVCVWIWRQRFALNGPEAWLLMTGLGVLAVHSLLELPHAYAYFLLPAAVMVGTLNGIGNSQPAFTVGRAALGVALACLAALLAMIVGDYRQIESQHQSQRLYEARIGTAGIPAPPPRPLVLKWVPDSDGHLRTTAREGIPRDQLLRWRDTLRRYPVMSSLYRHAVASSLNQDAQGAAWALGTLCALYSSDHCRAALAEWQDFASQHAPARIVELPSAAVPLNVPGNQ